MTMLEDWPVLLGYVILREQSLPSYDALAIRSHLDEAVKWLLNKYQNKAKK